MDNEMREVTKGELCKLLREIRTVLRVVIAIGVVCICAWLLELFSLRESNTKVIPNAGYQMYVTIDAGTKTYEGEAVVIAVNEEITVIQMKGNTYIAPTNKVAYE